MFSTRTKNYALLATAATLVLAACAATPAANPKVKIMVGGLNKHIYAPAMLAQQLGYFKDACVDVELLDEAAGQSAEEAMLAGQVDGVVGFYDHTIDLQGLGKKTMSVVQFAHAPGEAEMLSSKHPEVKSPANFGGIPLGVTSFGSSTDLLTRYLATSNGVALDKVQTVPVGAGNTFIAALQQDKIFAGMTTDPTISRLLKTGEATVLVDMRTVEATQKSLGVLYPASCLYMQTSWIEKNKDPNVFSVIVKGYGSHHRTMWPQWLSYKEAWHLLP